MLGATSTIMPALSVEGSSQHCEGIVAIFAALRDAGHDYLSRSRLTALYLAWAAFPALIQPLPETLCLMKPLWRDLYTWTPSLTSGSSVDAISRADLSQLADTTR